jgi:hypothetical protein
MHSIRQIILLVSLLSSTVATSIDNGFDFKNKNLRHQKWDDSHHEYEYSYGNETTVSPSPSVAPTPAPSDKTVKPTTLSPTTAPPTTAPPTTAPPTTAPPTTATPTTAPPTTAPPTPSPTPSPTSSPTSSPTHHPHHEWWKNLGKFLLKTVCWMFIAGLFFFAFGAVMSNRYRIYYYLRGSWYSILQKLKWSRRSGRDGSAPSSTLNDIIFSDNSELQEGLLMRET